MDRDAILFAHETFNRAFADRDPAAMEELWAKDVPVVCIHPGWAPLTERDAILASWRAILTGRNAPDIQSRGAQVFQHGDTALVICFEKIGAGFLVATNGFVRQRSRWKMVHHQAGPTNQAPTAEGENDDNEPGGPLN
jgi:ketosteroid isomerase-like protein